MKNKISKYLVLFLLSAITFSCTKDVEVSPDPEKAYVKIKIAEEEPVNINTRGTTRTPIYKVDIVDSDGVVIDSYDDHTTIGDGILLKPGTYTFKASFGTLEEAAFDMPYYEGEKELTVSKGETYTAEIKCYLANVKVSVNSNDVIKNNFREFKVSVSNDLAAAGGELDPEKTLIFDYETEQEEKAGYFKCTGVLTYELYLENNHGIGNTIKRTIGNIKPKEHYTLNFSIKPGEGSGGGLDKIIITIDKSYNDKPHIFEVNLYPEGVPEIENEQGYDLDNPIDLESGNTGDFDLDISATKAIASLFVEHNSAQVEALGIPRSFDIIDLDAGIQAAINTAGLTWEFSEDQAKSMEEENFDPETAGNYYVNLHLGGLLATLPADTYDFAFSVEDVAEQKISKSVVFLIKDAVTFSREGINEWARFADIAAEWTLAQEPSALGFEYKKAVESEWQAVPQNKITLNGKYFSTRLTNLADGTEYEVRATYKENGKTEAISFTTERVYQLPGMGFEHWHTDDGTLYPNSDLTEANYWWDTGNAGGKLAGSTPTTQETSFVKEGNSAAKLKSEKAIAVFAAGNIFLGEYLNTFFSLTNPGAEISFGRPYTSRPARLKGYFNYTPGKIDMAKSPYAGLKDKTDSCHIYVVLSDLDVPFYINTKDKKFVDYYKDNWVAYGEFFTGETSPEGIYEQFTVELEYFSLTRKPKHAIIVATSSKYGDYFTGSTSSLLYLDEFEFEFDSDPDM